PGGRAWAWAWARWSWSSSGARLRPCGEQGRDAVTGPGRRAIGGLHPDQPELVRAGLLHAQGLGQALDARRVGEDGLLQAQAAVLLLLAAQGLGGPGELVAEL